MPFPGKPSEKWTEPRSGKGKDYSKTPQCQAVYHTNGNKRCQNYCTPGKRFCKRHGDGNPNFDPTHVQTPHARAQAAIGREKYWARMRLAAQTDPDIFKRFGGGRPKGSKASPDGPQPKRTGDAKLMFQAEKIITEELQTLPAVPDKPFDQLEPHEQLVVVTGQSLRVVHDILKLPVVDEDGKTNIKIASMVKDTAIRTLGLRVKIDSNAMKRQTQDKVLDVIERLKAEAAKQVSVRVIEG